MSLVRSSSSSSALGRSYVQVYVRVYGMPRLEHVWKYVAGLWLLSARSTRRTLSVVWLSRQRPTRPPASTACLDDVAPSTGRVGACRQHVPRRLARRSMRRSGGLTLLLLLLLLQLDSDHMVVASSVATWTQPIAWISRVPWCLSARQRRPWLACPSRSDVAAVWSATFETVTKVRCVQRLKGTCSERRELNWPPPIVPSPCVFRPSVTATNHAPPGPPPVSTTTTTAGGRPPPPPSPRQATSPPCAWCASSSSAPLLTAW